jgi:hypothetical protein
MGAPCEDGLSVTSCEFSVQVKKISSGVRNRHQVIATHRSQSRSVRAGRQVRGSPVWMTTILRGGEGAHRTGGRDKVEQSFSEDLQRPPQPLTERFG